MRARKEKGSKQAFGRTPERNQKDEAQHYLRGFGNRTYGVRVRADHACGGNFACQKDMLPLGRMIIGMVTVFSSFGPVIAVGSLPGNLTQTFASGDRVLNLLAENLRWKRLKAVKISITKNST